MKIVVSKRGAKNSLTFRYVSCQGYSKLMLTFMLAATWRNDIQEKSSATELPVHYLRNLSEQGKKLWKEKNVGAHKVISVVWENRHHFTSTVLEKKMLCINKDQKLKALTYLIAEYSSIDRCFLWFKTRSLWRQQPVKNDRDAMYLQLHRKFMCLYAGWRWGKWILLTW